MTKNIPLEQTEEFKALLQKIFPETLKPNEEEKAIRELEQLREDLNNPNENPDAISGITVLLEYEDDEMYENTYLGEPMTDDKEPIRDIKSVKSAYQFLHYYIWLNRFSDKTFEVHVKIDDPKCKVDYYVYVTIKKRIYAQKEGSECLQKVG